MIKTKMLIMFLLAVLIPVGINYASKAVGDKIPSVEQEAEAKATPVDMLKSFFKGKPAAEKPAQQTTVVSSRKATINEIFIPEPETIANYYKDLQSKH